MGAEPELRSLYEQRLVGRVRHDVREGFVMHPRTRATDEVAAVDPRLHAQPRDHVIPEPCGVAAAHKLGELVPVHRGRVMPRRYSLQRLRSHESWAGCGKHARQRHRIPSPAPDERDPCRPERPRLDPFLGVDAPREARTVVVVDPSDLDDPVAATPFPWGRAAFDVSGSRRVDTSGAGGPKSVDAGRYDRASQLLLLRSSNPLDARRCESGAARLQRGLGGPRDLLRGDLDARLGWFVVATCRSRADKARKDDQHALIHGVRERTHIEAAARLQGHDTRKSARVERAVVRGRAAVAG